MSDKCKECGQKIHNRDWLERFFDRHNHKLAFVRTLGTIGTLLWIAHRLGLLK